MEDNQNGMPTGAPQPAPQQYAQQQPANTVPPQQQPYTQYPQQQYPQYQPPQPGYPAYPYPPERRWNGLAIAGFVMSFFISIVGLILSIIGYGQCKKNNEKGQGLALSGIIISAASIILFLLVVAGGLAAAASM